MNRFALFAGPTYYPYGGWQDFVDTFDTASAASARAVGLDEYEAAWWHIIDLTDGSVALAGASEQGFNDDFHSHWHGPSQGLRQ